VLDELKRLEHEGYHFEVADGSLELLLRRATGWAPDYFTVESFRVITDHGEQRGGDPQRPVRRDDRGHGQGARGTPSALSPPPRATARSTRSTPRCGPPSGQVPVLDHHPPDRLPGARPRYGQGHRRGHPRPGRHDRRERSGPPSGCPRTSSRPAGRPSTTRSSSGCSTGPDHGHDAPHVAGRGTGSRHDRVEPHLQHPVKLPPPRRPPSRSSVTWPPRCPTASVLLADRWYPARRSRPAGTAPRPCSSAPRTGARSSARSAGSTPSAATRSSSRAAGGPSDRAARGPGPQRAGGREATLDWVAAQTVVRRPPRHVGRELPRHDAVGRGGGRAGLRPGAQLQVTASVP
jgi:hypothetical protein